MTRIFYWVHHTAAYDGNSGVQRVVRALGMALSRTPEVELVAVRWCAEREAIVLAEKALLDGLARYSGPELPQTDAPGQPLHLWEPERLKGAWLLVAEVPHVDPDRSSSPPMPVLLDYARYYGLRSAFVFYDLIPIRAPGYEAMRAAHAEYARALAAADLVLPISHAAGSDLRSWWGESGHDPRRLPRCIALPLAAEMVGMPRVGKPARQHGRGEVRLLALGTVEPRKNQVSLMEAVNRLAGRRPELSFRLDVVGNLHGAVAEAARRAEARSAGRIRLHGYLADDKVRDLTAACDVTVFVSLAEGYGLPIAESLWQGRPCVCSDIAPMSEIAEGGGCLLVDPRDRRAIEAAIERIVVDADLRHRLTEAACSRRLASWSDYGRDVLNALVGAPKLQRLVVVEGQRGGCEPFATELEAAGAAVQRVKWRGDSQAIIPGFEGIADPKSVMAPAGYGNLRGAWAVLALSTTATAAEAMRIEDEAHGLGLKVALLFPPGRTARNAELLALASVDLALFATEHERDAALDAAFRSLPRTATLRSRFRVAASSSDVLAELAAAMPRTTAAGVPDVPRRIFYWVQTTATQRFNTGIQRLTRALGSALCRLGVELVPVKWNTVDGGLQTLDDAERAVLGLWGGPAVVPRTLPESLRGEWLLHPEITVPTVPPGSNVPQLARDLGMRVAAIFFDLVPAKLTEIYPPAVAEAFAAYWAGFSLADVAMPISWTVAADLRRHLAGRGLPVPAIVPCPLAGDLPNTARQRRARPGPGARDPLRLITVGTWEPRKNYPRLLRALMLARELCPDRPIELAIVGRRSDFPDFEREVDALVAGTRGVTLHQHVSDDELARLYDKSHATVFASWEEGFGLPVLESLWRGLPCLCHAGSALAEVAPGGGTLAVDMLDVSAIAAGIERLRREDALLGRLAQEAVARPIRDWEAYARDVLSAMAVAGTAPGWPLTSVFINPQARPLLSCAITTYNRARWLTHSLPRLIDAVKPFGSAVEVVVCDNASTDATPEVIARHAGDPRLVARRNAVNVGMLGNLGATARAANGKFVWLLGDDDLVVPSGVAAVLAGLDAHSDVEMAYMNYAYTTFDEPEELSSPEEVIRQARPIGFGGPSRRVDTLKTVAALNENLFTAIYACAFRRDHALRAYQQDTSGAAFSSLLTCVPSSVYALAALQDRPAWWVGEPVVVVNMNVSWLRWALLWHLERMPDLFDMAELAGIDPTRIDRHRHKHCWNSGEWTRAALMQAEIAIRQGVSVERLVERCKHVPSFASEVPKVRAAYRDGWKAGRIVADARPPEELFRRFGFVDFA